MEPDRLAEPAALLKDLAEVKQNSKCDALERRLHSLRAKLLFSPNIKRLSSISAIVWKRPVIIPSPLTAAYPGAKAVDPPYVSKEAQILVSTESGGEGLNFQFCSQIINFDLPWNPPMRLEQRIGRVHRLGQTEDVHIFNLITKDTIEEHIVYLLHQKKSTCSKQSSVNLIRFSST